MEKLSATEINLSLQSLSDWRYEDGAIGKKFTFKNSSEAFAFMSRVALLSEKMNHHPDWSGIENEVNIKLSSHEVNGITKNDIDFANEIETF